MRIPILIGLWTILATGCVTTSKQWKTANQSEISSLCSELVQMSRPDSLESRKATMDQWGFETTSYTDGIARVSVLTRPDLVVVVTHAFPKLREDISAEQNVAVGLTNGTDRMWNAVSMQIEAIQATSHQAQAKVETIFMAQEMRWNDRARAFQQVMTNRFKMRTVTADQAISSVPSLQSSPDREAKVQVTNLRQDADIL